MWFCHFMKHKTTLFLHCVFLKRYLIVALFLIISVASCKKESPNTDPQTQPKQQQDQEPDNKPSKLLLVRKNWKIDSAYHDGDWDISSTGKRLSLKSNGTYVFDASLNGNWEFTTDSVNIIVDKGLSYQQDWKIEDLSSTRFKINFKSPFTGKKSI